MEWSATQYLKFEDERSRPARDLIDALPAIPSGPIFDLGCGPANSTELLKVRFPGAHLTGLDSDDDMLAKAQARMPETPFIKEDISRWQPPADAALLFSNALFQWVPNHIDIFGRLLESMTSGAVFAVQMPDNLNEPTHALMEETAMQPPFSAHFSAGFVRRSPLPSAASYYESIRPYAARIDLFHITYHHILESAAAIVEWVKGTGLRPYLEKLPQPAQANFLSAYQTRIEQAYPAMEDGRVMLNFPRLFIIATAQ